MKTQPQSAAAFASRTPRSPRAKYHPAVLVWLTVLALTAIVPQSLWALGDKKPSINAVYPSAAFAASDVTANSARWDGTGNTKILNIKTHFGAAGNGTTDDTTEFQAAFDFIKARQIQYAGVGNAEAPGAQWMIYVPDGTYLVSDTIQYSGAFEGTFRGVRIVGQSRNGTIIKLKNSCTGFTNVGSPKPVLAFDKAFNNLQGHNMLRNITVDVGTGNAGAVGVDFLSPNSGRIDNVTIMSSDSLWKGAIGLHLQFGIVHGYISNLTVDGFDTGIKMVPYHMCNPALEHITLTNQKITAIEAVDGGGSFRDVYSNQTRTDTGADAGGVKISGGGAHVIMIDSSLVRTGSTSKPAVEIVGSDPDAGHFFGRAIDVSGYASGVNKGGGAAEVSGDVAEYVSDAVVKYHTSSPNISMNLPIEEVPFVGWETDLTKWDSPDAHGAVGDGTTDDASAVQAAVNGTGKSVIYLPMQQYKVATTITVPAKVKRIDLMATELTGAPAGGAYFEVTEASPDPLIIHDINDGASKLVKVSANRTVILDSDRKSDIINNGTTGQRIYVNNGNSFLRNGALTNMRAWCRFVDTEAPNLPNWSVDTGGVLWVMGYKIEDPKLGFQAQGGGWLEVLGGITNQFGPAGTAAEKQQAWDDYNAKTHPSDAANINLFSNLSLICCNSGPNNAALGFENMVGDNQTSHGIVMTVRNNLPPRAGTNGRAGQYVLPLYLSYDAGHVPQAQTFTSIGAEDGFVTESTETSNVGGSKNSGGTGFKAIRAGDTDLKQQTKGILSFDTSALPDTAVIDTAVVLLKRGGVTGTDPFSRGWECRLDIKTGGFNGSTALENADFQAAADATNVAQLSWQPNDGEWAQGILNATGLTKINKTGKTQFRVYFSTDDDNNATIDDFGWWPGEAPNPADAPQLMVTYHLP